MRVLIVSPYRTVAPHFEHELEVAQRHLDQGDRVSVMSCLGELQVCDFNPTFDASTCNDCRLRRAHGFEQLEGRLHAFDFVESSPGRKQTIPAGISPEHLVSIEQLKAAKVNNFDVGYAALSSLVSQIRDPEPDLNSHRDQVVAFSRAALQVYRRMIQHLATDRPDRVYVFNGRFAAMRAVVRACQLAGVECLIHERGCDTSHFQLFRNHLPHDIGYIDARMREHWNQAVSDPDRQSSAGDWFHSRVLRVEKNWHSFVKSQQRGRLPDSWDFRNHNVVLFTSSEDEFVAIGDCWANRLYEDQATAIHRIASDLLTHRPDARLTVRIHPNLIGIDNPSTRRLAAIDLPNVILIPADAVVDSYQLMRVADTVASFGSSIGIESVFWSKPSVLLGPCFYQNLQGPLRAQTHQQAIKLLAEDQMPAARHDALIYGFWQNTHGIGFRYFEPDGLFTGTFKGQVIYPKPANSFSEYVGRRWKSVRKRITPDYRRRAA